jgi:thymidylate synthase
MYWKGILHEIIWMLKGDTNIKYLVDNNISIWTDNAYKYYLKFLKTFEGVDYDYMVDDPNQNCTRQFTKEEFVENIKEGRLDRFNYKLGDLGGIYGLMWRKWGEDENLINGYNGLDQIEMVIKSLKENPYSRYHLVTAWDPSKMFDSAQPNCHILFQMNCREISYKERVNILIKGKAPDYVIEGELVDEANIPKYYLDCKMVQRSCDTFLGVPFNIGQYAFVTHIFAKLVNMIPGELIWSGNSVHIYENHIEQVKEQLKREPLPLCQLKIHANWGSIDDIKFDDFEIIGYDSWPAIKGDLSVGF